MAMAPREQRFFAIAALAVAVALTSSNGFLVSADDAGGRHRNLRAPTEPIIRNRQANVFPFHTAIFPQLNIRNAIFGDATAAPTTTPTTTPIPSPVTSTPSTEVITATTTIILPAATITFFATETDVKTLYSTKTIVKDNVYLAKIIPFDRAATANPECMLEVVTKTLTDEVVGGCVPLTTTLTKNPSITATQTVTGAPVTETYKSMVINTKSTTVLAAPHHTVTNIVTVFKPVTVKKSQGCDLATVYQTVTESLPDLANKPCDFLQTTVTESVTGHQSTVTQFEEQTITETMTVDPITACPGAVTETGSATRLTVMNYEYVTETITERARYPFRCSASLTTATETIRPTITVPAVQVSFVKKFQMRSGSGSKCQDTVTVTPTTLTAEVVNEFIKVTRTIVKSSFDFADSGTEIIVVRPTVTVTDTQNVDVTVTEIMADRMCALK